MYVQKIIPEKSTFKLRCAECGKHFGYIHGNFHGGDGYIFRIEAQNTGLAYDLFCSEECCNAYYEKFNKD